MSTLSRAAWVLISASCYACSARPDGASEIVADEQSPLVRCVDLNASADASLAPSAPRRNFGTLGSLRVGRDESLIAFDLSSLPSGATIDTASLSLYATSVGSGKGIGVHRALSAWSETGVSYRSFAQSFEKASVGTLTYKRANQRQSVDVTALVSSWLAHPEQNNGVLLEADNCGDSLFGSREACQATERPGLHVCYALPEDHCIPNPCQNGGVCSNASDGYACSCGAGFGGATCEQRVCDGGACAPANLVVSDSLLHFDETAVGAQVTAPLTITNTGELPTTVAVSALNGPDLNQFSIPENGCTAPLQPHTSCTLAVRFAPTTTGTKQATFGLFGGVTPVTVQLTGNALLEASLAISPSVPQTVGSTDVGIVGESALFTIYAGPGQVTTGPIQVTLSDALNFEVIDNSCSVLAQDSSCTFNVRFKPQVSGPSVTQVTVLAAAGARAVDTVTGLGSCPRGFTGATCQTPIDYCANNPCKNGGTCLSGSTSYSCSCPASLSGTNCEWFDCASAPDEAPCNDGNACTRSDACSAGVCVGSNPITCTPIDACHDAGTCDPQSGACSAPLKDGMVCQPATASVTPARLSFGVTALASRSPAQTITVTNIGDLPGRVAVSALTGPDANQFTLDDNDCLASLAPGASCLLQAGFQPLSLGSKSASFIVFLGQPTTVTMTGESLAPAGLVISPSSSINFGTADLGTNGNVQAFTISTATGEAPSGAIAFSLSDASDFQILENSCTMLNGGSSCIVSVRFSPQSHGLLSSLFTATATPGGSVSTELSGDCP